MLAFVVEEKCFCATLAFVVTRPNTNRIYLFAQDHIDSALVMLDKLSYRSDLSQHKEGRSHRDASVQAFDWAINAPNSL